METGFELSTTWSDIMINSHLCQKLKILGECDYNDLTIPSIWGKSQGKKFT